MRESVSRSLTFVEGWGGRAPPSPQGPPPLGSDTGWEDAVTTPPPSHGQAVHPGTRTRTHTPHSTAVYSCQRCPLRESTFNNYCSYHVNVYPFLSSPSLNTLAVYCGICLSARRVLSGLENSLGRGGWETHGQLVTAPGPACSWLPSQAPRQTWPRGGRVALPGWSERGAPGMGAMER